MRGWISLSVSIAGVLVVWTVVLPWVGSLRAIRSRIEFLESQRIDPSAMFYTDLEVMDEVHANMAAILERDSEAFWNLP